MKKIVLLIITLLCVSGCSIKRDVLENITIYTTDYPTEYITNYLYGENSNIKSIYPNEVNIEDYTLNNKQIKDYSKANMFIFNGLTKEKDYLTDMFTYNKDLMIIDATQTMEYDNNNKELWLDPSNFLMMSLNIKNGLLEYISNHYLKKEIEEKYDELKINISNIDAKLKLLSESSNNKTIITDDSSLKFLEKYGFEVMSLEENDDLNDKIISDVINNIENGTNTYIYSFDKDNLNDTVKNIISSYPTVQILELNNISNLTENQRNNKDDYVTLTNENFDLLKNELYK